jgi:hypothetical protein
MRPDVPDASILFQKARTKLPPLQGLQRQMLRPRVVNESNSRTALEHVLLPRPVAPAPLPSLAASVVSCSTSLQSQVCACHTHRAQTQQTQHVEHGWSCIASLHCSLLCTAYFIPFCERAAHGPNKLIRQQTGVKRTEVKRTEGLCRNEGV